MVFILLAKIFILMNLHPSLETNDSESNRILELHKKATKSLYLIREQDSTKDTSEVKSFKLPNNTFPSGKYENFNKFEVDRLISQMNDYLKNFPLDQKMEVEIEASESRVPMVMLGLNQGELSGLRAQELQKYLKGKLPENVIISVRNLGAQGPEWDKKIGKDNPQYTRWQYVTFNIKGQGKKLVDNCKLGFSIIVDYQKEWCKYPEEQSLCHKCDEAIFYMWANGIPILDKNGSPQINLNNRIGKDPSGPSRVVRLDVDENQKKQILEKSPNEILITYGCALEKCHSEPIHVTIINSEGGVLLPGTFFSSKGKKLSNAEEPIKLLKMDSCGNVMKLTDEERFTKPVVQPQKIEKPFQLETDEFGYKPESLYALYKFVGKDQIFRIPQQEGKKFRNYTRFQNGNWKDIIKELDIDKKDLKRLSDYMNNQLN